MTRVLHKNAAAGGWARLELVEQLGNVGSEVERAIRAHEAGRTDRFESALERALELFDLTAADPRWRGHRCQEILRAREELARRRPGRTGQRGRIAARGDAFRQPPAQPLALVAPMLSGLEAARRPPPLCGITMGSGPPDAGLIPGTGAGRGSGQTTRAER